MGKSGGSASRRRPRGWKTRGESGRERVLGRGDSKQRPLGTVTKGRRPRHRQRLRRALASPTSSQASRSGLRSQVRPDSGCHARSSTFKPPQPLSKPPTIDVLGARKGGAMSSRNSVAGQSTAAASMASMQVNYPRPTSSARFFRRRSLKMPNGRDRVDLRDSVRDFVLCADWHPLIEMIARNTGTRGRCSCCSKAMALHREVFRSRVLM